MGYDTEIFVVQPVKSHFICIICNDVLENPVECSSCECMFCYQCYQHQIQKSLNKCPQCRKNLDVKKSSRNFVNLIMELLVKCTDCQEEMYLEKYEEHLKKHCKNQYISCTNKGCNSKIMRKDLQDHIQKCELYETTCQKCKCIYFGNNSQAKDHSCIKFLVGELNFLKNEMSDLKSQLKQFQSQMSQLSKMVSQFQKQGTRTQAQSLQNQESQIMENDVASVEESKVN